MPFRRVFVSSFVPSRWHLDEVDEQYVRSARSVDSVAFLLSVCYLTYREFANTDQEAYSETRDIWLLKISDREKKTNN